MAMHTVKDLQARISNMDLHANFNFSKIKAVAKLALHALETPNGVNDLMSLGHALEAIAAFADDGFDAVGCEADEVGEGYTNEAAGRRVSVQFAVRREWESMGAACALNKGVAP